MVDVLIEALQTLKSQHQPVRRPRVLPEGEAR